MYEKEDTACELSSLSSISDVIQPLVMPKLEMIYWLGVVSHACNPTTLGGQGRWIMRSRDRDHPGRRGETPSLLKIQKLAGHGGARL